jgi:hypothetical protein
MSLGIKNPWNQLRTHVKSEECIDFLLLSYQAAIAARNSIC